MIHALINLSVVGAYKEKFMGRGSAGNVIAALCSFFIPGLGQLLQGRWILAGFMFVMSIVLWVILLGWVIHLWSIIDAALYTPPDSYRSYRSYRRYGRYDW
jgi:TM2 domain-containing membrane protein YozV